MWQYTLTMPIREAEGRLTHCAVMGFTVRYLTPPDCKNDALKEQYTTKFL